MKVISKLLTLAYVTAHVSFVQSSIKMPVDLFEKWIKIQHVVQDRDLTALNATLDNNYLERFKKNYEELLPVLRPIKPLLSTLTDNAINNDGYTFKPPIKDSMISNMSSLFSALENNPTDFITFLQKNRTSELPSRLEQKDAFNLTIETYKALVKLLISAKTPRLDEEYSIALANRLVEFCYNNTTFPLYQSTMQQASNHSIARILHSVIWYNIIGNGWKLWHKDCLDQLKIAADNGKRIKYIAGGNDIYTMLCEGIYNITIIDPFLPWQQVYYATGWEWLLAGTVGDEIIGIFGTKELRIVRTSQQEGESFSAKAENQYVSLKKIQTSWTVYDAESDKQLGTIEFDRRPVIAQDLVLDPSYEFLMSYDEFIYLGLPSMLDGWGIEPNNLDPAFTCLIKQLRKPMNRDSLNNLRIASVINYADLKFINLASNPN